MVIQRKRKLYEHIWPIDKKAGKPPEGWKGWPDGKKFALVLMHDVDTDKGQQKCLQLMQLDEKMGFRSSFNFVPERYHVSSGVRRILVKKGFEVGVHGLKHDGKLFSSRKKFHEQAVHINHYLKDWQSVGFVSPSMHRNLDWIHDLNIEYDASTFDTDPFEPQPEGMNTIFPFWVPRNSLPGRDCSKPITRNSQPEFGCSELVTRNSKPATCNNVSSPPTSDLQPPTISNNGFVELPYTLPQDHTLFVIMGEKDIGIWKKKLDWIAEQGGMALLITHPDYMIFNGDPKGIEGYPVKFYKDFLEYIREKYKGCYWHALPQEVAKFLECRPLISSKTKLRRTRGMKACMVSYSFYENDNRVMRYAETLAERGDRVDVIALRKEGQAAFEVMNGVNVYRVQERIPDEKGKFSHLGRLLRFFYHSSLFLSRQHLKDPYRLVHVHSIPDFEVFAGILPKLSGASLILDIHDIVPELYASKFNRNPRSLTFRLLTAIERVSTGFSNHVIISNHLWGKKLLERSLKKDKCTVILNYPNPNLFHPRPKTRKDGRLIFLYPGTLNWHQGLDIAIRAFSAMKNDAPQAEFHIYGRGSEMNRLEEMVISLDLIDRVLLKPLIPISKIADVMANADIGIIPKRNDSFGGEAFSTKILEFMALGIPVIVAETKIDKYYFNDSVVKFFEPGNPHDLAKSMLELMRNKKLRERLSSNALKFVQDFSWEKRKHEYLSLVDRLSTPQKT